MYKYLKNIGLEKTDVFLNTLNSETDTNLTFPNESCSLISQVPLLYNHKAV